MTDNILSKDKLEKTNNGQNYAKVADNIMLSDKSSLCLRLQLHMMLVLNV